MTTASNDTSGNAQTKNESQTVGLSPDRAIQKKSDDHFSRRYFAEGLARQIIALPKEESFVLGLSGPWGSGKTSILNLIEEELQPNEEVVLLWFNPWLFSGTEELLEDFFAELAAQIIEQKPNNPLSVKIADQLSGLLKRVHQVVGMAGSALTTHYGGSEAEASAASAAASAGAQAIADKLQNYSQGLKDVTKLTGSVKMQRRQIEQLLRDFKYRVVIFIDDLDRLRADEVREVVRLVRLTANFPNLYYLLAFDRFRVEAALADGSIDKEHGRAYLEKIFQIIYDIPPIEHNQLISFLGEEITRVTSTKKHGPILEEHLHNIFRQGIAPLFNQPRDVRRYINSLLFSLDTIGEEIALPDLLGLEAIRTLLPQVFAKLQAAQDIFCMSAFHLDGDAQGKKLFDDIVDNSPYPYAISKLLNLMFPLTSQYTSNTQYGYEWLKTWRRERRVAYLNNFQLYLSKTQPDKQVRASQLDEIFKSFEDEARLNDLLSALDSAQLENAISRLEDYEYDYKQSHAKIALSALINQAHRLSDTPRDWFGPSFHLKSIIARFLRKIKDAKERYGLLKDVFNNINWFSWKLAILDIAEGWHEDEAKTMKLIDIKDAEDLKHLFNESVKIAMTSNPRSLNGEKYLSAILEEFSRADPTAHNLLVQDFAKYDDSLVAILISSMNVARSQTIGASYIKIEYSLPWLALENLLGADLLRQRVIDLKDYSLTTEDGRIALTTALDYVEGRKKSMDSQRTVESTNDASLIAPSSLEKGMPLVSPEDDGSENIS